MQEYIYSEDEVKKIAKRLKFSYKYNIPIVSKFIRKKAQEELYKMVDDNVMWSLRGVASEYMEDERIKFLEEYMNKPKYSR